MDVRISKREFVGWSKIKIGQCFRYDDELYMRIHYPNQFDYAVRLSDGEIRYFLGEECCEIVSAHVMIR